MSVFNRKKITDFLIYGFGQVINLVSPLFVMPFIIYKCGEDGLGKVGVGFSLALILNGIIDYGSYIKGVQEISINRDNKVVLERKFKSIYLSKLLLTVLVFILLSVLVFTVPFFSRDKTLFFFSFFIVIGQFINPQWFFQGVENFKWISIVNVISKTIYILLVLILVNQKSDYIYANLFFGIGAVIGNGIGLWWLVSHYGFVLNDFSFKDAIVILKEEFSFSVSQIFLSLYQFFPIMVISYIGGDFMAGQFRVIDQIVSVFKTYLNMFFYFVYANICYELNKNIKSGIKVWQQYNGFNFGLLLIVLMTFYLNSEYILTFFKIHPTKIALMADYFKLGLIVPLFVSVSQPLRQLIFAFNENKIYIRITIIATIFNFILLYILTNYQGLKGAFYSIIIIEFIIIVLYLTILRKHFNQNVIA
ncbi:oligosaccharide flippase family protein [Flavobacterium sp.]|uniref:oligosaccharide flippase family protein n=1 Tax=Flavobacterium sp. TaxID=239 RepID=UPI00391CBF3A